MAADSKIHRATEKRDIEWCITNLSKVEQQAKNIFNKINHKFSINSDSKILELGAAQGLFLLASKKLGYNSVGIEPYQAAISVSNELAARLETSIDIKAGIAEEIPFEANQFDVVIALSVLEHVKDVSKTFSEVYRTLKPDGCFYFVTTSALCPKQGEIRSFPLFSWYPNLLKLKILNWTMKNKPHLVGDTDNPAINWFTPWKVNKLISKKTSFSKIYNRWYLINEATLESNLKIFILKLIRSNKLIALIADIFKPGSSYLVIKTV